MSTQCPSQLNFQPWYTQRRPSSSFRPKKRDAPRCGQWFWISPILPDVTRKAMRFSPRSRTRTGAPSRSGSWLVMSAGIQYWRRRSPVGVPRPTRQSSSLSSLESITLPPVLDSPARLLCHGRRAPPPLHETTHQHDYREDDHRHHQRRDRGLFEASIGPLAQEERRQDRRLGAVEKRHGRQVAERHGELYHPACHEPVLHE